MVNVDTKKYVNKDVGFVFFKTNGDGGYNFYGGSKNKETLVRYFEGKNLDPEEFVIFKRKKIEFNPKGTEKELVYFVGEKTKIVSFQKIGKGRVSFIFHGGFENLEDLGEYKDLDNCIFFSKVKADKILSGFYQKLFEDV